MSTETMTPDVTDQPDPASVAADTDFADAEAEHVAAIRAQVESADPGPMAQDDDTRTFYRYLRIRAQAVAELTTLKDQMAAMVRSAESRVKSLDYVYSEFAARVTAAKLAGGKSKSLKTPFGTVGYRTKNAALVVVDASAVPDEFKSLKTEEVLSKAKLNEHFKLSGEVPPGCDVAPVTDKFYLPD
jgi:hypothetical protein